MVEGGGAWNVVQPRHPRARAKGPGGGPGRRGGGAEGGGGVGARERGAGAAGAPGGPPLDRGQGGRRGQEGGGPQPRPNAPRCNLEVREHSVCLLMDNFQTLPSEQELVDWLDEEVWKDEEEARIQVMEGFRFLSIEHWAKRMILTVCTEEQVNSFLEVMGKDGERGRLWPGLEGEVRVRAEAMTKKSLVITVMDVAPETDKELVRGAMEKFGTVKRCERMTLPAPYNRVQINKMKVELVRNNEKMPNIIHAFGTARSAADFLTWKLQYRGCPRYCFSCGATAHEARQCTERRAAREKLEKVASLVGEEQEETGEEQLSYAAVLKDPTFLARQRGEREEEKRRVAKKEEQRQEREARSAREEQNRREKTARGGEAELRERAERELERERRDGDMEMELEERGDQEPPPPEGNPHPPLPPPPPRSGEVAKVAAEEAKVVAGVVAEEAKVAPQLEKGEGVPGVEEEVPNVVAEEAKVAPQLEKGEGVPEVEEEVPKVAPPKSGEVKEVPGVEEEVPKVVVEEAKVAGVEVAEVTRVVAPAQPKLLTTPQPREQGQEKKDTQQEGEPKRGRNMEKMKNMLPGKKRDNIVVYDMFGRSLERARSASRSSPVKRRSSPSLSQLQDLQGSSKTSRTSEPLDPAAMDMAVDNNRNSLPSAGQGTDDGGASSPGPPPETLRDGSPSGSPLLLDLGAAVDGQRQEEDEGDIDVKGEVEEDQALEEGVRSEEESEDSEEESEDSEEESKDSEEESQESEEEEEGSKRIDRKPETAEELIGELRRRLEATGPPPAWVPPVRVRTLVTIESVGPAGSIMAVHRLSEKIPGSMLVTVDGTERSLASARHNGAPSVEIID